MSIGTPLGKHLGRPLARPGGGFSNSMPDGRGVKPPLGFPANTNRPPAPAGGGYKRPPSRGLGDALGRGLAALALAGAVYEAWKPYEAETPVPMRALPNITGWVRVPNGWIIPGKAGYSGPAPVYLGVATDKVDVPDKLGVVRRHYYSPVHVPNYRGGAWVDWNYGWTQYLNRAPGWVYPVSPLGDPVLDPVPLPGVAPRPMPYRFHPGRVSMRSPARHAPNVAVVIRPGRSPVSDTPAGRPRPGVREGKYRSGKPWVNALLSTITEGLDLWNVVVEASGWKYVPHRGGAGFWQRNPDLADERFWQQWDWFIDDGHWRDVDGEALARGLVEEALEDWFYGKFNSTGNRKWLDAMDRFGFSRPHGPTVGPVF